MTLNQSQRARIQNRPIMDFPSRALRSLLTLLCFARSLRERREPLDCLLNSPYLFSRVPLEATILPFFVGKTAICLSVSLDKLAGSCWHFDLYCSSFLVQNCLLFHCSKPLASNKFCRCRLENVSTSQNLL